MSAGAIDRELNLYPLLMQAGQPVSEVTGTAQSSLPSSVRKRGTPGADRLDGSAGNDLLEGLGGNDTLYGYAGADALLGNEGNDQLYGGAGDDSLNGGTGSDTIDGGAGADTVVYTSETGSVVVDLGSGTARGSARTDRIFSIEGVFGSNFNDTINGSSLGEWLTGGDGNDSIHGNDGDDRVAGGAGGDTLSGGNGSDVLLAGGGFDIIDGGDGIDTAILSDFQAGAFYENSTFTLNSNKNFFSDSVKVRNVERIQTADGTIFRVLEISEGFDGSSSSSPVVVGGAGTSQKLVGTKYSDVILGGGGADTVEGGDGNDILQGSIVWGGDGSDTITGSGSANIWGGAGNDVLEVSSELSSKVFGGVGYDILDLKWSKHPGFDIVVGGKTVSSVRDKVNSFYGFFAPTSGEIQFIGGPTVQFDGIEGVRWTWFV